MYNFQGQHYSERSKKVDKYLDESKFELPLVFPDRVRQSALILFPVYFRMFCARDSLVTDAAGDRENERDRITINSGYGQMDYIGFITGT